MLLLTTVFTHHSPCYYGLRTTVTQLFARSSLTSVELTFSLRLRKIVASSLIRFRRESVRGTQSDCNSDPRGAGRKTTALSSHSPSANLVGKSANVPRAG